MRALDAKFPEKNLIGKHSSDVEEWITFAVSKLDGDFKKVSPALEELEDHLALRSFIVGHEITAADIAVWGTLKGNNAAMGSIKKSTYVNVGRWFRMIELNTVLSTAMANIAISQAPSKNAKSSGANFEIGLQNASDGSVVTRFPPEPSGYLHIGHAKAAMLNQYFAQKYHGKLIIRFDDTNPSKEKTEFQDAILEDLEMLGIKGNILSYTSDHFDALYKYAIQLIKLGDAYVDDTDQATMRHERMEGIASKRRDRSVEDNLGMFAEMTEASEEGQKNCVRAKMSVDDPNKALRDPVIYRCNLMPHHRTGSTWKIYPTYDFCCPIVDSIEGVTHALRTIEYRDRNPQYEWFLNALSLRKVHVWDFSRMNFVRTLLSKRKLQWFVDQGIVSGWDDPRFPTVRGIRRRGMQIEALREFILAQGPSKNINNLDWTSIWAINKKAIDPVAPRHTALSKDGLVRVSVEGGPEQPAGEDKPKHKKNEALGNKKVYFSNEIYIDGDDAATFKQDEEITLMDWGNAFVTEITKSANKITSMKLKLHLEGDFKKTEKKVTWLSSFPKPVEVELRDFDYLITKEKLEEGDDIKDFVTEVTEFKTQCLADQNVASLKKSDVIQFERKGYFIVDVPYAEGQSVVFFAIPDGKTTNKYGNKQASEGTKV